MQELILRLAINTVALFYSGRLIEGLNVESWKVAIIGAIVFSLLNMIIKPIIKFISLPITILTLGLFTLVINGVILSLVAFLTPISIAGFGAAVKGAFVVSVINWLLGIIFLDSKKKNK